jgi:hypothetical protein
MYIFIPDIFQAWYLAAVVSVAADGSLHLRYLDDDSKEEHGVSAEEVRLCAACNDSDGSSSGTNGGSNSDGIDVDSNNDQHYYMPLTDDANGDLDSSANPSHRGNPDHGNNSAIVTAINSSNSCQPVVSKPNVIDLKTVMQIETMFSVQTIFEYI